MVGRSNTIPSDWFIDCRCMTHTSGRQSMLITNNEYALNTKKGKGYNGVASCASRYGSVRFTCQLPDGRTEMIVLQEVVYLPGSFNLISQFQIMQKNIKVKSANDYSLNLYNCDGKLIATVP